MGLLPATENLTRSKKTYSVPVRRKVSPYIRACGGAGVTQRMVMKPAHGPGSGVESRWSKWCVQASRQRGCFCSRRIAQPWVQHTYYVAQAQPNFCSVVGGPVSYPNRPKIACPRPTYPLPMWIHTAKWEEDEDEERSEMSSSSADSDIDWEGEEGFDEEFNMVPRFLTSFSLAPDAENLPPPFFPQSGDSTPSLDAFASLSPDASDLPQPCFDPDPPMFAINSPSSSRGVSSMSSSRSDTFESIVSPDPEDLPLPCFEVYAQFEVGGVGNLKPPDCRENVSGEKGVSYHIGDWATVCGRFFPLEGGGYEGLDARKWVDWTRDKAPGSSIT